MESEIYRIGKIFSVVYNNIYGEVHCNCSYCCPLQVMLLTKDEEAMVITTSPRASSSGQGAITGRGGAALRGRTRAWRGGSGHTGHLQDNAGKQVQESVSTFLCQVCW